MSKLYPCVYCTEDGYCKKYSDDEVTSWCVQSPCKDETPSNADRIRSKSDEELAEYLAPCACPPIRFNKNTGDIVCPVNKEPCESDCKSCWLDWLKQEAT